MTLLRKLLMAAAVLLGAASATVAPACAQTCLQLSDVQPSEPLPSSEPPDTSHPAQPEVEPLPIDPDPAACLAPNQACSDAICWPHIPPCGDFARLWLRGEYLLWWFQGDPLPALISTSPAGTPPDQAGVPGTPGYDVLYGDQEIADGVRGGGRITAGCWFDECRTWGVQVDWFLVGNDKGTAEFVASSAGDPILARPFTDVSLGQPQAALLAFPDTLAGAVGVSSSSELDSGGVLLRGNWKRGDWGRIDWLGGYRHVAFREDLAISDSRVLTAPAGNSPAGTTLDAFDSLATHSGFHGAEVGVVAEWFHARWSLLAAGKLALGGVHQQLTIDGATVIDVPAVNGQDAMTFVSAGGLLSQPTNLGAYDRREWGAVPELSIALRCHVTERCTLSLGYTLLGLCQVLRAGEQIDTAVNATQLADFEQPGGGMLVGPARPAAVLHNTSLWAQGLSFGLQLAH